MEQYKIDFINFMIDCQVIKQGAMFYVPDMSGDTEAIFTGEH